MSLLAVTSGDIASGVVAPEGVDFDGVSDYLSRSTDLVGNVDSKTFTFSCWVYNAGPSSQQDIINFGPSSKISIQFNANNFRMLARNSAGTTIFQVTSSNLNIPQNTYVHIMLSVDLTNVSNRFLYVNDVLQVPTWNNYSNDFMDFTSGLVRIAGITDGTATLKGRLSNIFLDYTYRDLSIEANRRLFITADGKPTPTATLKALNPILYLPMKDAATAHINEGTGGNFTLNGTIATSERGANQDNCVQSKFDGVDDYLSRTSLTGAVDGRQFTFSCNVAAGSTTGITPLHIYNGSTKCTIRISEADSNGKCAIAISLKTISNSFIAIFESAYIYPINYTLNIVVSIDTLSQLKKSIYVNGKQVTSAWSTYNINTIFPIASSLFYIANLSSANKGSIGELYFDTKYTDLATSNPFWDKDTNRPKPVRQVIRETGITPLIAMPLDASNAGKNYGTGGDFTANSAPYVGARSASEFWARSAKIINTSQLIRTTPLVGSINSKTFSFFTCIKKDVSLSEDGIFGIANELDGPSTEKLTVSCNAAGGLTLLLRNNTDNGTIVYGSLDTSIFSSTTLFYSILICIDTSSTLKRKVYINNVDYSTSFTWAVYTNDYINISANYVGVGSYYKYTSWTANNQSFKGYIGCPYFTTDYIDFSQEVNRNKFVDQLGYPKDLKAQIDAGVIPKPLIYLPFNDPSNLGLNLGTGGNFTVNGTISQGADVNG